MDIRKWIVDRIKGPQTPDESQPGVHCYVTDDENDKYNWLAGQLERMEQDKSREAQRLEAARRRIREK